MAFVVKAALVVLMLWIAPDGSIQGEAYSGDINGLFACATDAGTYHESWCEVRHADAE